MEYTPHGDPIPQGFANAHGDWMPPEAATNERGDPWAGPTNDYGDLVPPDQSFTERGDEVHNPYQNPNTFDVTTLPQRPSAANETLPPVPPTRISWDPPQPSSVERPPHTTASPNQPSPTMSHEDTMRVLARALGVDPEKATDDKLQAMLNGLAGSNIRPDHRSDT